MSLLARLPIPSRRTLAMPVRYLPAPLVNLPLEKILTQLLQPWITEGDLDFLQAHCLKIVVRDIDMTFFISFDGKQLQATAPRSYDVAFQGDSTAFMQLLNQQEDPDALFFQRRLIIEGDTELALGIKNLIYNIEQEQLPKWLQHFLKVHSALQQKLPESLRHILP